MTTLTLDTTLAIAPVSDLSDVLLLGSDSETVDVSSTVGVRRYAGGRDRVVSSPGQSSQVSIMASYITRADYLALLNLVGVLVLVRDVRGRRIWGVIGSVSGSEAVTDFVTASFTLTSATVSEIV